MKKIIDEVVINIAFQKIYKYTIIYNSLKP